MSKHNYSKYSDKKKTNNTQPKPNKAVTSTVPKSPSPEVKMEVELIQETVDTVTLPKTVSGVVVDCAKLNVREEPSIDADVVCVLDVLVL